MIHLTSEQYEKIHLIDKIFNSTSLKQLREMSESEQIVARLKGIPEPPLIFSNLVMENTSHSLEIANLRSELHMLNADFQILLKLVVKPYEYNAMNDAQTLKSKHGIY